jgi:Flp pilus assembly protein TadD
MSGRSFTLTAAAVVCSCCVSSCGHHSPVLSKAVRPSTQQMVDRQAVNAVDAGDGDYQLRQLRAALDANPGDLKTRFALAARYQSLGFHEVAIEHGRLALERVPESEEAHVELAKILWRADRSPEAAKSLGDFARNHEVGVQAWAWLGLVHDDAGEWKAGEAAYRKALTIQPDRDDLHNNLGYCLLSQGRRKEAETEFREAVRLDPHSIVARNNLGSVLTSNPAEAVENLQSVADPATAHNNLAAAFIEAGKYAEARREIDEALRYNRQHPAALSNLELLSSLDGKPAEFKVSPRKREGSWLARTWHRKNGSSAPDQQVSKRDASRRRNASIERNDAGSAAASRQQATN